MGRHQADAAEQPRGVPRVDDRRVLNGIFWVLRSGAPWRDLPDHFGPYTTCYLQTCSARSPTSPDGATGIGLGDGQEIRRWCLRLHFWLTQRGARCGGQADRWERGDVTKLSDLDRLYSAVRAEKGSLISFSLPPSPRLPVWSR